MDNHFNPGYMSYGQSNNQPHSLGSFGGLSAQGHQQQQPPHHQHQQHQQQQQQQQHQQPADSSHPTLPPLQNQNGGYSFGALSYGAQPGSQSHTPTTPHTPATSSMTNPTSNAYSHISPTATSSAMMPPSTYGQYSMSSLYPSSTATAMPATTSAASSLPALRPMPVGGLTNGLPSLNAGQLGQQPAFVQNEEAPTHVVGSQGRRGVLPSAPGRPNPPAAGSGQSTKSMIPQKDADGKFPCPHCNKTYLHAKHLKRHLLRHTGDRPYMCHLCKDTFSRSDILKRHFQKCSIRRGNPTGANHLAHQRRNTNGSNRLSISQQDGPIGLAGLAEVAGPSNPATMNNSPTVNGDLSARSSRANSLISPASLNPRGNAAGLGILGSNAPNQDGMPTTSPYAQGLQAYAMHNNQNANQHMQNGYNFNQPPQVSALYNNSTNGQQMSFLGQQSSRFDHSHSNSPHSATPTGDGSAPAMDWSRVFSQSGQDGFLGSQPANASSQAMNPIKAETVGQEPKPVFNPQSDQSFLGSLYSLGNPSEYGDNNEHGIPGFPNWGLDDPLQAKVDSLLLYCFPHGLEAVHDSQTVNIMRTCLTVDNVKHFAEHFTSFHGHWPIIHMPTFKLTEANNALVLAMICVGAIYSPKLNVSQVRQMMEFVRSTVCAQSSVYNRSMNGQVDGLGNHPNDVEELQALTILQAIFTWHGTSAQRHQARASFPTVVAIAKAMELGNTASSNHYAFSILHWTSTNQIPDLSSWHWQGWLEQEKRNRVFYLLFLTDVAMAMYFNSTPQIDPLDIRLSLPADDAAWDAGNQQECADALGLNGATAQVRNVTGTKKWKQPGMREAMRTLMEPNATFQHGATNVYSKFILIHALITRIIGCQKLLLQPESGFQGFTSGAGSGPATPLSQNDWLEMNGGGSGTLSPARSGHSTPADGFGPTLQTMHAHQERKRLGMALDKWKRMWDMDMSLQYPPQTSSSRRFGFSRDGVHFFFLGRSFLSSQSPRDWNIPADARFKQVISTLKKIKQFVLTDEARTQNIGSVGDIDDQYGLDDLTLDMKLLFKPYNSLVDSPVAGVQTH